MSSVRSAQSPTLAPGKPSRKVLEAVLRYCGADDQRVALGPGFGRDAAVIDLGERLLVLKSDPVTFAPDEVGWYAVHVNANDLAVVGCAPAWFQATIFLPVGSTMATLRAIARDIHRAARDLGIAVTGGHTEVTPIVQQPVVAGDLQGVARKSELVRADGARPGDLLVMSKTAALEGTAILARSFPREAKSILGPHQAARAAQFHRRPGISLVREALIAARLGATAMHDPTEGGLRAALAELAVASGRGLKVHLDRIPIAHETLALCQHFSIDPLGLISSGTLLATVPPTHWESVQRAWNEVGVAGTCIGEVIQQRTVRAWHGGRRVRWHWSEQDELARLFSQRAYRRGTARVMRSRPGG